LANLNKKISNNNKEIYFPILYENSDSRLMQKVNEFKNESKLVYCSIKAKNKLFK
jgi:hypothetical protein